jgi:peptidoglycan glycosyltransferase
MAVSLPHFVAPCHAFHLMRRFIGAGVAVGLAAIAVFFAARSRMQGTRLPAVAATPPAIVERSALPLLASVPSSPRVPPLAGIDLTRIALGDDGATAPAAERRVARLTLDPELQRAADRVMAAHHLPEAAMILVDTATGRLLAYASHLEHGEKRDLCAEATAPSASVFKIVTGAALVEDAGLSPDTRQCYSGGEQKLLPSDIEDDPRRDRWCTTLAGAMGHSTNAVFAKLALHDLKRTALEAMAARLGYGEPVPFDVPVQASTLALPVDPLGYARTAAGFWNSTLSPLEAAWLSATVARGGDAPRLSIVGEVADANGGTVYTAPEPSSVRRAMQHDTALALTRMMEVTVSEGTSYRAFHDGHGLSFLPGVAVAGKTGTLTNAQDQHFFTWFTGFAPSRPLEGGLKVPPVAVAVLVVNRPQWHVKANVLARELLREYFARQHVPGVTAPTQRAEATSIARRE